MNAVATKPRAAKKVAATEKTWPELTQPIVARIGDMLQHAAQFEAVAPGNAFRMIDGADCALFYVARAPLTDSLWNPSDPVNVISVLECVRALMTQGQREHGEHGGLNEMHVALLPALLHALDLLTNALMEAPGDLAALHAMPQAMDAALTLPAAEAHPAPPTRSEPGQSSAEVAQTTQGNKAERLVRESYVRVQTAGALLNLWLSANDDGAVHGAVALISIAEEASYKASVSMDADDIVQMLGDLHNATEVLNLIAEDREGLPIWAVLYLLRAAIEKSECLEVPPHG